MEQWYQLLVNHLNEHLPNYGDGDAESILEMVYSYYNQVIAWTQRPLRLALRNSMSRWPVCPCAVWIV